MITAVDTNVLIDVFRADPTFGPASAAAIRDSLAEGRLVACPLVWAEVVALFPDRQQALESMDRLGVNFDQLHLLSSRLAGERWAAYRRAGGPRERVISDFLIGAHAVSQAERILSRDRGYFRTYFPDLTVIDPSSP